MPTAALLYDPHGSLSLAIAVASLGDQLHSANARQTGSMCAKGASRLWCVSDRCISYHYKIGAVGLELQSQPVRREVSAEEEVEPPISRLSGAPD
jgi:hypothetical protein